ncbi:MAG: autotransporter outer membrane beta-barrel domain-containing protein [Sphingomonas sp.]
MRAPGFAGATGVGLWAQGIYADGTDRARPQLYRDGDQRLHPDARPRHQEPLGGRAVRARLWDGKLGRRRGSAASATSAAGSRSTATVLNLDGYTAGVYARWQNGGGFLQALVKYDGYKVRQISVAPSFEARFDGSTIGAQVQAGYDWKLGATFIEPVVALSWTAASLDTFSSPGAGATVDFGRASSVHGNAGVRIGTPGPRAVGPWRPMSAPMRRATWTATTGPRSRPGPTALAFADDGHKANALGEIGIVGRSDSGFEIMAVLNGATGGNLREVSGPARPGLPVVADRLAAMPALRQNQKRTLPGHIQT